MTHVAKAGFVIPLKWHLFRFSNFARRSTPPTGPGPHHYHTETRDTQSNSSGRAISPTQEPLPDNTQHSQETSMPPTGFEPAVPASQQRQTHGFDRPATGMGFLGYNIGKY